MKLLDNYNRISLMLTILVIFITGVIYYFAISYVLTGQVDQDLVVEEHEIFDYVNLNHKLPQVFKSEDLKIYFQVAGDSAIRRRFVDTSYYNPKENERESARALISSVKVNGTRYSITIIESKVETEDLIRVIFLITLVIVLVLILLLVIINRVVIRKLWQPFYQMLSQITLFNLTDKNTIAPVETRIDEFNEMNREVTAMSLRVRRDYLELKSFVENAAHELMTPIAVINSKLDTLVQDGLVTDRQGALIGEVYNTLSKMRRLNRSMLMLSRIENKLISQQESLNLKEALCDLVTEFQELFAAKGIDVTLNVTESAISMNKDLLDILLNNLLTNAVNHNHYNGRIIITLQDNTLIIANTGINAALNAETIFQRFNKSADSEGSGLGLNLIKEICQSYAFSLSYQYEGDMHVFSIRF